MQHHARPVAGMGRQKEQSLAFRREVDGLAFGIGDDESGPIFFDQRCLARIVHGERVNEEGLQFGDPMLLLGGPDASAERAPQPYTHEDAPALPYDEAHEVVVVADAPLAQVVHVAMQKSAYVGRH